MRYIGKTAVRRCPFCNQRWWAITFSVQMETLVFAFRKVSAFHKCIYVQLSKKYERKYIATLSDYTVINPFIGYPSQLERYGVPFSHLFTELQISPIEVHIPPIELDISAIELHIYPIQLQISPNTPIWRYLQFNGRYLNSIGDISPNRQHLAPYCSEHVE